MEKRTYALLVAYDGGPYKGWQPHPVLPTVAGVLGAALRQAGLDASPFGASRTDAGVHARAQVASFGTRAALDLPALARRVGEWLPSTIRLLALRPADGRFHAHWSSRGKVYRYRLSFAGEPAAWRLPPGRPLDPGRLERALAVIEAAPDLSALSASPGEPRRRTLERARLLGFDRRGALLEVAGPGFGKYLVRHLVAAAAAFASGEIAEAELARVLAGRAKRPVRAAAEGLCLFRVLYPPALDPFPDADLLVPASGCPLPATGSFCG